MAHAELSCLNSQLGTILGFAAGTLLVSLVAIPLVWWRDRRRSVLLGAPAHGQRRPHRRRTKKARS